MAISSRSPNRITVTEDYTVKHTDDYVTFQIAANKTATLPHASQCQLRCFQKIIINQFGLSSLVTIVPQDGDTFEGVSSITSGQCVTLTSDGISKWSSVLGVYTGTTMVGISGFSGPQGYSGVSGYSGGGGTGLSGFSGFSGTNGSAGVSGFSGYSGGGTSGFSGFSGSAGSAGDAGTSGFSGYSGLNGSTGQTGQAGTSGFSGYSGNNGAAGAGGASGFSGYSGAGVSGFSGFSGATSTSGFSGYSGVSGFSGYSGISGFSGTASVYALVSGSNATTTGQALVDITGLSIALSANAVYEYQAVLSVLTSAVTTGVQYGVNYSAAGGAVEGQLIGSSTATATKSERVSALNTASGTYLTTSGQNGQVLMKGIITTGVNAGNFTVKHLKVTSGTSTVRINSFLKVTRIS